MEKNIFRIAIILLVMLFILNNVSRHNNIVETNGLLNSQENRAVAYVIKPWSLDEAIEGLDMYKEYNYSTAILSIPIDNKFNNNEPKTDVTDEQLNKIIDLAEQQGLEVILKCHNVSIYEDGQGNRDQPSNPKKWFNNYKSIVDRIADIAVERGHDKLIISNEMHNVLNISQWEKYFIPIIESAKSKGLKISCSTNIPEIKENDGFRYWDELDFFSVNTYPQLTDKNKYWAKLNYEKIKNNFYVPISDIDVNYGELFENLGGPHNLHKDIWITEIGCIPSNTGLEYPAYWGKVQKIDEEVQEIYMDAVINILENDIKSGKLTNRIKKYTIWDGNGNSDFNIIGKKAQSVIDKYWKN